ncbi:MAG: CARDB domain-containing protein [Candidatus Hydrothermarchaeales archaeon]
MVKTALEDLIALRTQALELAIKEPARNSFDTAESAFQRAVLQAEADNISTAKRMAQEAESGYREAILISLREGVIQEARMKLEESREVITPEKYEELTQNLNKAEAFFEQAQAEGIFAREFLDLIQKTKQWVFLSPNPLPDLTVELYDIPYSQIKGIDPFPPLTDRLTTLSVLIKNVGLVAVNKSFSTELYVDGKLDTTWMFSPVLEEEDPLQAKNPLKSGGTRVYSYDVTFTQKGKHTLRWVVDAKNKIPESDESKKSNVLDTTVVWQAPPDLVVEDIWPVGPSVGGQKSTWKIKVKNIGKGAVNTSFPTTFWPEAAGGKQEEFWTKSLAAGQTVTFTTRQSFRVWGKRKIRGTVDAGNFVPEAKENNNEFVKQFDLTPVDLKVDNLIVTPKLLVAGKATTFSFTVTNIGTGHATNPFKVKFFPGKVQPGLTQPYFFTVNKMTAGQSVTLQRTVQLSGGDHQVSIEADFPDPNVVYFEPDRNNNVLVKSIHVLDFTEPFKGVKRVIGKRKVLAILWDPKRPNHTVPSKAKVENTLFGSKPSVRDYFLENSKGQFTIEKAGVLGWYKAKKSADHYWGPWDQEDQPEDRNRNGKLDPGEDLNGNGELDEPNGKLEADEDKNKNGKLEYDLNNDGWIHGHTEKWAEAIRKADKDFNFAQYDNNPKNGVLDAWELAVYIIIPQNTSFGTRRGALGKEWPKKEPLIVDGVKIPTVIEAYVGYPPDRGLLTHELSHMILNLPDMYYDYDIAKKMKKYDVKSHPYAAHSYSMMDVAKYHLDPFHKLKLGWIKPTIVHHNGWYTIQDVETHYQAYILYDPNKVSKEYFIVENRWPGNSYDKGLPDQGLAVWHIIEDPKIYEKINEPYTEPWDWGRRAISLRRVNGGKPLSDSQALWDGSDPKTGYDLSDTSSPSNLKWQNGQPSGLSIKQIPSASPAMKVYISVK